MAVLAASRVREQALDPKAAQSPLQPAKLELGPTAIVRVRAVPVG
jgi:hypothetical protein